MNAWKTLSLLPGIIALFLLWAGCAWTDKGGTHHLIVGIGFGVITTTNRAGVDVRDSRVLGVEIRPEGAGVGWMRHHGIIIDPAIASNVVISVKANSLGLTIKNFDPYSTNNNEGLKTETTKKDKQ